MSDMPHHATALLDLVRRRRSCRRYDSSRTVPREVIEHCLEAARLAPSACNRQPWHFVLASTPELRRALCAQARLPGIAHTWWEQVPLFVALCVRREVVTHRLAAAVSGIAYELLDAGIAGEHFVLAATEAGLGTCWVGWFRERVVRTILPVPKGFRVVALITVGYPLQEAADATPQRKPTDEIRTWA